jgi:hypothetical protein
MLRRIKYIDGRLERRAKWLASSGGTRTSWATLRYGTVVQSEYDAPLVRTEEWETDALVKLLPDWARLAYDEVYLHRSGRTLAAVSRGIGLCGCAKRILAESSGCRPWQRFPRSEDAEDIKRELKRRQQRAVMLAFGRVDHDCTDEAAAAVLRNTLARADRLLSALIDQRRRGEPLSLEAVQSARRSAKAARIKQVREVKRGCRVIEQSVTIAAVAPEPTNTAKG